MSYSAVPFVDPLPPSSSQSDGQVQVVQVVVPVNGGTVAEALRQIRGDVPAERNTLELLSAALDDQAATQEQEIVRRSRLAAIIYG